MVTRRSRKKDCCPSIVNLPKEMEVAVEQSGGLEILKRRVPLKKSLEASAGIFHALSEPIRLQIMHALLITDLCPCLLTEIIGLSNSKLSYHLSILEENGMVLSQSRKKWRIYSLTDTGRSWMKIEYSEMIE